MTGFSDPVYAEAYVHVNQYDIVLDVLVVNQTSDTLQNLTLELATLGKFIQSIFIHNIDGEDVLPLFKSNSLQNNHLFIKKITYSVKGVMG